jgi:GNAT superfamily N-acetyltransferase
MVKGMNVRPYETADREPVLALAERLLIGMAAWNDVEGSSAAVHRWVRQSLDGRDDDHVVLVAATDDGVLGFVTAARSPHFTGREEAHVGELVVAESAERSGAGRALMHAVEVWAAERSLTRVSLETGAANVGARRFYAALGYLEEEVRLSRGVGRA